MIIIIKRCNCITNVWNISKSRLKFSRHHDELLKTISLDIRNQKCIATPKDTQFSQLEESCVTVTTRHLLWLPYINFAGVTIININMLHDTYVYNTNSTLHHTYD